jgi:hypothetical protein
MSRTVQRFEKEVRNAKVVDLLCLWAGGMLPAKSPPYMSKDWQ